MSNFKVAIIFATIILLLTSPLAFGITVKAVKETKGVTDETKGNVAKKNKHVTSNSACKVRKVSGVLEKIEGNMLILKNGATYKLSNARIINYGGKRSRVDKLSKKRKIVELTFVNNALKEVVIR